MGQAPNPYNASSPLAIHASGGIGAFVGPFITVRSYLEYTRLQPDAGSVIEQIHPEGDPAVMALSGGSATATAMMLDLKLNTPLFRSLSPYVVAGVGALRFTEGDASLRLNEEEVIEIEGDTVFGPVLGMGGGINIVVSDRVALFVEGRYHMGLGSADAVAYAPVRMGFAFR